MLFLVILIMVQLCLGADDKLNSQPLAPTTGMPKQEVTPPGCQLEPDPSVEYNCIDDQPCGASEPHGAVVRPRCRGPSNTTTALLEDMRCTNGQWNYIAKCSPGMCRLEPHYSVEYRCVVSGTDRGTRPCELYEPPGTVVSPRCREPIYYSATTVAFMRCVNGHWDYIAKCTPECGRVTPSGTTLVVGGLPAKKGELPWHAGIYLKTTNPYMQICGGSLVSNTVVISAAHCFWRDVEQLPASSFAVAVGKLYRPWNDTADDAQKSDVAEIHLPPRFQGAGANFQDDIAVLLVDTPFEFNTFVRPVCLSFDLNLERLQLQPFNSGKLAGWPASPLLRVVEMPYVDVLTCLANSPFYFAEYITSDKICAGSLDSNVSLCRGDSGGGLAFSELDKGLERYYLRGVASVAPRDDAGAACNTRAYSFFTQIHAHESFIKQFLDL